MVRGIKKYATFFKDYTDNYVLIGGMACHIIMDDIGIEFRATKDFDIVLVAKISSKEFFEKMWEFIIEGDYENKERGNGKAQFYRFTNPKSSEYPMMIELFSSKPTKFNIAEKAELTPIPIDQELDSLSAILLDDDYYNVVEKGKKIIDDISVLSEEYLMLMKMKAWVDLNERKSNGESIDSKNINKHKKDVFRLFQILSPTIIVEVNPSIRIDVDRFIQQMKEEQYDLKNIGITTININDVLEQIDGIFIVT